MPRLVNTHAWDPPSQFDTVVVFHGHLLDDPDAPEVTFGVDHRMAMDLAEAIKSDGSAVAQVEDWQIL